MTSRNNVFLRFAVLAVAICLATKNFANSEINNFQGQEQEVAAPDIDKWIEQLSAESLIQRQEAREKLTAAGQAAVPALAKAALSEERDLIAHSIDILGDIAHKSTDADAKDAAKITLEMLSESEQLSTAERAKLALDAEKGGGIQAFPGWDKPGSEFAGGGPGMNRSVSVSNVSGIKTITVKENGMTTTLQDLAGGKIYVHIDGGEKPREFTAKNLDDLKKQDEGAFALYQQHAKGSGIAGFPGFGGMGNFGIGGNAQSDNNSAQASDVDISIAGNGNNAAMKQLMIRQLTELRNRMAGNPQMQKMLDGQIEQLRGK